MRARGTHILLTRLLVAVLIAATSVGAWAGPELGGITACSACAENASSAPVEPVEDAHACCDSDGHAHPDGVASGASDEAPPHDCCPDGCGVCCRAPARVPVVSAEADAVIAPTTVDTLPSTPPTLPAPAGVHRSIFHPPRH